MFYFDRSDWLVQQPRVFFSLEISVNFSAKKSIDVSPAAGDGSSAFRRRTCST